MIKRGQVTGFIIAGVVIVIIAVLLAYLGGFKEIKVPGLERFHAVESFLQECLDDSARNAVLHNMRQGGYSSVYSGGVDMGDFIVPYYLIDGVVLVPDRRLIEEELAIGLEKVDDCLDFSNFEGFSFEKGENRFNVSILEERVVFNAHIPVKVSFNGVTRNFDDFKSVLSVDLMNLVEASSEYVELQKDDSNATFIGGLGDIAFARDLDFEVINVNGEVVYSFIDGRIDDKELEFMFAVENEG